MHEEKIVKACLKWNHPAVCYLGTNILNQPVPSQIYQGSKQKEIIMHHMTGVIANFAIIGVQNITL